MSNNSPYIEATMLNMLRAIYSKIGISNIGSVDNTKQIQEVNENVTKQAETINEKINYLTQNMDDIIQEELETTVPKVLNDVVPNIVEENVKKAVKENIGTIINDVNTNTNMQVTTAVNNINSTLTTGDNSLSAIKTTVTNINNTLTNQTNGIQKTVNDTQTAVTNINNTLTNQTNGIQKTVNDTQTTVNTINSTLTTGDNSLSAIKTAVTTAESNIEGKLDSTDTGLSAIKTAVTNNYNTLTQRQPYYDHIINKQQNDPFLFISISVYSNNTTNNPTIIALKMYHKNKQVKMSTGIKATITNGNSIIGYIYDIVYVDNLTTYEDENNVYILYSALTNKYYFIEMENPDEFSRGAHILGIVPNSNYVYRYKDSSSQYSLPYFRGCTGYHTDGKPIFAVEAGYNVADIAFFTLENHPEFQLAV